MGNDTKASASSSEKEASNTHVLPAVSLPKGGGAVRGIADKLSVVPATGMSSLSVPVPLPPGRGAVTPGLALAYDSGTGNSPFGFGWSLQIPAIRRRTDKGIPTYDDIDESDIFTLAGAEDLVPVLDGTGARKPVPRTLYGVAYTVQTYRPRIDAGFARIERWTATGTGISHWRTIDAHNITTVLGADESSCVFDPADPRRIFAYLASYAFDDSGNVCCYTYVADDGVGVDLGQAHERNRTDDVRRTQRYISSIAYGNFTPYYFDGGETGAAPPLPTTFRFEVVLDYGDHNQLAPTPARDTAWPVRPDPFTDCRGGFEVRTYRRCHRALVFHNFPEETAVGADCLVTSIDLAYADELAAPDPTLPIYSMIGSITPAGYRRDGQSYVRSAAPATELVYSAPVISADVRTLDAGSLTNLPEGLDGSRYRFIDLDGEGLPGILADIGGAWGYKRNLSPISDGASFTPPIVIPTLPAQSTLDTPLQLVDLSGAGLLDAATFGGATPGYYARTPDADWAPQRAFAALPSVDFAAPSCRFVDLTGDGLADLLCTEEGVFTYFPSLGTDGFGAAIRAPAPWDDDRGPAVVLDDGTQTIYLADMTGDGLSDLVRIRDGEVSYWPNLGYGRFGARVSMDHAPRFTSDDRFDPRRIHLADIDGSGMADLVYVGEDGVQLCFNQSGNGWTPPRKLPVFPPHDRPEEVRVVDLLGTGTACLVWSSPLPGDAAAPLRYVDLMSGQKPHLLTSSRNNLGAETRVTYAPSTRFYLADQLAGHPWVTKLPFPVYVVERTESYDWIGLSRFVTRYAYHHGFYDGVEREFRGFGMVEQWDTDEHRDDTAFVELPDANWDAASWSPPCHTRTWFHTGAFTPALAVSQQYASEYWFEPGLDAAGRAAMLLPDTVLPDGLTPEEMREAYRALKGTTLRIETYADDGTARAPIPYSVTEQNMAVARVQAQGSNRYAIFTTGPREAISYHYERDASDPRIGHEVVLELDAYNHPTRSVSIAYPRRLPPAPPEPTLAPAFQDMLAYDQARLHVRGTQQVYTAAVDETDAYRVPLVAEAIAAELTGVAPAGARFTFDELDTAWTEVWNTAHDLAYEDVPRSDVDGMGTLPAAKQRRIIKRDRTLYRRDDLTGLLDLLALDPGARDGESYQLALTTSLVTRVFGDRVTDQTFIDGGYVRFSDVDGWWTPSGRVYLSAGDNDTPATELAAAQAHFYLPRRHVDPFGGISRAGYDDYNLAATSSDDAVGNHTSAEIDYRVLAPRELTDPNGNRASAAFDSLGRVVGTAVAGKTTESVGDTLDGFVTDLDDATIQAHLADPLTDPGAILGGATSRFVYDLFAYERTRNDPQPLPVAIYTLLRETHVSDLAPGATTRFQHGLAYCDGFERIIQKKQQAETSPWVGSGWTIFDNKGRAVRTYEPFFTQTPAFELARQEGVATTTFYDPIGRVVATLRPDSAWTKTIIEGWRQESWDGNDTAMIADPRTDADVGDYFARALGSAVFTSWHDQRIGGTFGATADERAAQQDAAKKTEAHANTPAVVHFDGLGRACLAIDDAGAAGRFARRMSLDTEGQPLAVFDALGHRVFEYCVREPNGAGFDYVAGYDLAGGQLYQCGMDGGERRVLADAGKQPVRTWDAMQRAFTIDRDALRRVIRRSVSVNGATPIVLERTLYGEGMADANLCGQIWRVYGEAGLATHVRRDFTGNLVESTRQLASGYRTTTDWTPLGDLTGSALDTAAKPLLDDAAVYTSTSRFDALARPIQVVTPHRDDMHPCVVRPDYDARGLPALVDVWLQHATAPTALLDPATADIHAITSITYDARGQVGAIARGNGVSSSYTYDPLTFRIANLVTTRSSSYAVDARTVQDLSYFYDPSGNVTRIRDDADTQDVIYFRNQRVDPTADYTCDAIYRLVSATGREHLGQQAGGSLAAPAQVTDDDSSRTGLLHPGDGNAMATYVESYQYDSVGNLLEVVHQVSSGSWTRPYHYNEPSQITATEMSNRLSSIDLPGGASGANTYDAHGNMVRMPHLPVMAWSEDDHLRSTTRQVVSSGIPETTYYAYGAGGDRARKVTDRQGATQALATRRSERIYLGGIEIYREYAADGTTVTLERETLDVPLGKERVLLVETRTAGTDAAPAQMIRYQHGNHLSSVSLELDDTGDIVSYEEYFPFGSTSYQAVRSQTDVAKRYRYTGKERDEESSLYYHGARYYAPWLGRWTAADPQGLVDGTNLYAYARSAPTRLRDPNGTSTEDLHDKASNAIAKASDARVSLEVVNDDIAGFKKFLIDGPKELQKRMAARKAIQGELTKTMKELNSLLDSGGNRARVRELQDQVGPLLEQERTAGEKVIEFAKRLEAAPKKLELAQKEAVAAVKALRSAESEAATAVRDFAIAHAKDPMVDRGASSIYRGGKDAVERLADRLGIAVKEGKAASSATKDLVTEDGAKTLAKIEAKAATAEKDAAESFLKRAAKLGGVAGERAGKYIPWLGVIVGAGFAAHSLSKGEKAEAAKDMASGIPVIGEGILVYDVSTGLGGLWGHFMAPFVYGMSRPVMGH